MGGRENLALQSRREVGVVQQPPRRRSSLDLRGRSPRGGGGVPQLLRSMSQIHRLIRSRLVTLRARPPRREGEGDPLRRSNRSLGVAPKRLKFILIRRLRYIGMLVPPVNLS